MPGTSLALYSLQAQPVDRAEPSESLKATTVWSHGLGPPALHLSADAARLVRRRPAGTGRTPRCAGGAGPTSLEARFALAPGAATPWTLVADVDRTQRQVVELRSRLRRPARLLGEVRADVATGRDDLNRIVAATDGLQLTADRLSSAHHLGNVLFNDLRGGVFAHGYDVPGPDFAAFVRRSNVPDLGAPPGVPGRPRATRARPGADGPGGRRAATRTWSGTPTSTSPSPSAGATATRAGPGTASTSRSATPRATGCSTSRGTGATSSRTGRRSRLSYPEFAENVIAKFVNASTADGHNPYRLTKDGIDWEVPDPGHPWSTIGYWGDHQIVYLLKLLELSLDHHPERLRALLERELFSYANVPYEILPFDGHRREPALDHPLRRGEGRPDPRAVPGDGLRRQAPAGRRRRRARQARREAARGGARQDVELRAGRRASGSTPSARSGTTPTTRSWATASRW